MKHRVVLFILFFINLACFSQEQSEWLEQGDLAFMHEDYLNAVTYYQKALSKEVTTDIVRPYEIAPYIKKAKREEENETKTTTVRPKQPAPKLNQPAQMQQ